MFGEPPFPFIDQDTLECSDNNPAKRDGTFFVTERDASRLSRG
jgi:hypothetical protein